MLLTKYKWWRIHSNCRLRIYKLEYILLHNTFLSTTVFSFYIFTFLLFRNLNKPQLTKNKQHNLIGIRAFHSRLYLDSSRSFNCPKCSHVDCLSVWFVITCGRFVSCFSIARIHFKSSYTRQFWTLNLSWGLITVGYLY